MTTPAPGTSRATSARSLLATAFRTEPSTLGTDIAAVSVRIVLVWIFVYYGAGKLFGAFDGPGIHQTSLFMESTAHLHPGGLFAVLAVYGAMVAFAHSNTRLGFGPLERIFVSPNYHRIHHRLDGAQDVNLGFALTIWDQLFHRAVFPTEATIRADTGLPGRPLVVEQAGDRPHHLATMLGQLWGPFRPIDRPGDEVAGS